MIILLEFNFITGLAVYCLMQIFMMRFFPGLGFFKSLFIGFFCGLFAIPGLFLLFQSQPHCGPNYYALITTNILTYLFLSYCYSDFLMFGESALRIRIMREILESKNGLSLKDILDKYNVRNIIGLRLKRLESKGQIFKLNDRYYLRSGILVLLARGIKILRYIFTAH